MGHNHWKRCLATVIDELECLKIGLEDLQQINYSFKENFEIPKLYSKIIFQKIIQKKPKMQKNSMQKKIRGGCRFFRN